PLNAVAYRICGITHMKPCAIHGDGYHRVSQAKSTSKEDPPMAVYELPELDYAYDALEPHIAAEIMELHHSKHHQNYVNGANAALEKLEAARNDGSIAGVVTALSKDLAFNLGGHSNHSIFWKNLSPNGGGEPTGDLAEA